MTRRVSSSIAPRTGATSYRRSPSTPPPSAEPPRSGPGAAGPEASESGPSYLRVDGSGRFVLCACYRGHNVLVFPRESDGRLGPPLQKPERRPARPRGRALAGQPVRLRALPRLDRVAQYRFDAEAGRLSPNDPPAWPPRPVGSAPPRLSPDGKHATLVNELDGSVVDVRLRRRSGHPHPSPVLRAAARRIRGPTLERRHPCPPIGDVPLCLQPGPGTLAVFAVEPARTAQPPRPPPEPRPDAAQPLYRPGGRFLLVANQDSSNLASLTIHPQTGRLYPLADRAVAPSPTFVGAVFPG